MKKISVLCLSLLVLISSTVLTSCTKDDSGPVDLAYIEGKWSFNKSTASSSGFTINYSTDYIKNEAGCSKDYLEFMSGGIVKFGDYSAGCAFQERTGTWTQTENTIIISVTGSSLNGTFNIASLSANELILKIDGDYNGKSGTFNLYFTK